MKDWTGNKNSIYKTLGASNHTDKEREVNDYYATSPIAIDKLLTVEKPAKFIWECACGEGHLSERLKEFGYKVYSSDLIDRGYYATNVKDFFEVNELDDDYDILTNPPYKYAKEFVLHALDLLSEGRKAFMFLKLTFLEGKARFKELFNIAPQNLSMCFLKGYCAPKTASLRKCKKVVEVQFATLGLCGRKVLRKKQR